MRKTALSLALLVLCVLGAAAAPARVLSQPVLDRFLKDLGAISAELEAYGKTLEADEDSGAAPGAGGFAAPDYAALLSGLKADARIRAILGKYGWKDEFWQVYVAVMQGIFVVSMDEAYVQAPMAEIKKAADQARALLHPDDLALVLRNRDKITSAIEAIGD